MYSPKRPDRPLEPPALVFSWHRSLFHRKLRVKVYLHSPPYTLTAFAGTTL